MTKTEWEIFWEEFLDKFRRALPAIGGMVFLAVILLCFVLLGYNLRIHENEKYIVKNQELELGIEELKAHKELLSNEFVEVRIELDEYITIINNLQEHPLALDIIRCESDFNANAFNKDTDDWSYWQINDHWHREPARKRGYDIENPKENLQYGFEKYLEMNGLRYWNPSKHCWAITKPNEGEKK